VYISEHGFCCSTVIIKSLYALDLALFQNYEKINTGIITQSSLTEVLLKNLKSTTYHCGCRRLCPFLQKFLFSLSISNSTSHFL